MRAAVLQAHGQPLEMADVELAPPQRHEVLVSIKATGVCHSDLSVQQGKLPLPPPCVLGHEAAGVIENVGPDVTSVAPGDHVVVMWTPMCGQCFHCRRGEPQLCTATRGLGVMDDGTSRLSVDGQMVFHGLNAATFAEQAVLRDYAVVKIPDDVPMHVAAVVGCGVLTGVGAALYTAKVRPGDIVAVAGCGGVGVNVIQGARLAGAEKIVAIDTVASKLETARTFGATHTIDASETDPATAIAELTSRRGADHVFEVVGHPDLQRKCFDMTRRGGQTIFVGVAGLGQQVSLPSAALTLGEKKVMGCYYGSCDPKRDIHLILDLWRAGRLDLENLVTHQAPLEAVNDAFDDMQAGKVVRTVLTP